MIKLSTTKQNVDEYYISFVTVTDFNISLLPHSSLKILRMLCKKIKSQIILKVQLYSNHSSPSEFATLLIYKTEKLLPVPFYAILSSNLIGRHFSIKQDDYLNEKFASKAVTPDEIL